MTHTLRWMEQHTAAAPITYLPAHPSGASLPDGCSSSTLLAACLALYVEYMAHSRLAGMWGVFNTDRAAERKTTYSLQCSLLVSEEEKDACY